MIRRFALAACAVVAATSLSACATFSQNDAAAKVGQVEISQSQVSEIATWLVANKAQLNVKFPDLQPGLVDGGLTRTVVKVLVRNELYRQALAKVGAAPTADVIKAAEGNLNEKVTGPTRQMLVDNDALSQTIKALDATKGPLVVADLSKQHVYVDARYGAWDPATGTIAPLG